MVCFRFADTTSEPSRSRGADGSHDRGLHRRVSILAGVELEREVDVGGIVYPVLCLW